MTDYHKAGLAVIAAGRILLCVKRGLPSLILPGGSIEPGESYEACVRREVREELGGIEVAHLRNLGAYEGVAATVEPEPVKTVRIDLFLGDLMGEPSPTSEIEALVWFGPDSDLARLSPSLRYAILPDLVRRGLLPWDASWAARTTPESSP